MTASIQILLGYLGPEFMVALKDTQGQKLLIIQSGGSSTTNTEHFRIVRKTVQEFVHCSVAVLGIAKLNKQLFYFST